MRIDLTGRTALVTGSSAGIGYAIALGLARAGGRVVVNGRSEERAASAAARIAAEAGAEGRVEAVAADVGDPEGCARLIEAAPDVDVLVNNAGVFEPTPVFEIPDSEWLRLFEVNVMSGVRLCRHHVPRMVERGWGRVIFISSESALHIPAAMVHYGMTKTAQLAIARGMAESVPASGVTVNSVLPGPTLSEGMATFLTTLGGEGSLEEAGRDFVARERPSRCWGGRRRPRRWPTWSSTWPPSRPRPPPGRPCASTAGWCGRSPRTGPGVAAVFWTQSFS